MMIYVTNDAGNLILEIDERALEFYKRAGYHKMEVAAPVEPEQAPVAPVVEEMAAPEPVVDALAVEDEPIALDEPAEPKFKKAVKRG